MFNEVLTGMETRGQTLADLTIKVARELVQVKQLLDPDRISDLWTKGLSQLCPITRPIYRDISSIAEKCQANLILGSLPNGIGLAVTAELFLATVVFPAQTRLFFVFDQDSEATISRLDKYTASVSSTTVRFPRGSQSSLPSEGLQTSQGIQIPFRKRLPISQIQHGGFLIDNNTGDIAIINYEGLAAERDQQLGENRLIIEANWYMDSENYHEVAGRNNLQQARPYNCLGVIQNDTGQQRYFAITSNIKFYNQIAKLLETKTIHRGWQYPTMRYIAAMSNVIAKIYGTNRWAVGGLEYCGGGVDLEGTKYFGRHYFAAYLP